ncbi:MAG: hypothetical protein K2J01_05995 [Clostridiales bacterium]|nr:hypothetical protein [Clostridiales bacterium]
MLYEKKMLILSGEGKGVVLIEKSAKGLRFSLSTFDMPTCGELKAGVITPRAVYVRDLQQRDNPSSVFIVDGVEADNLHFAVFDTKLRLYGTNGKRMWEANVMDLLTKNDRRAPVLDKPMLAALPPISTPPKVLPMPDGTGIPQSRLEIYGDEQLAESNFYTHIDMSSRMPVVDRFLDTPRVLETPSILDGLAPVLEKSAMTEAETTAITDADDGDLENVDMLEVDNTDNVNDEDEQTEQAERAEQTVMPAAAATADSVAIGYGGSRPCELAARFLKTRSTRELKGGQAPAVKPITPKPQVKPLREISFIERAAADIDKLFNAAEKDEKLAALLPDINWVKVPIDGHIISVGRGGNDFLCYAVTGTYEKTSPLGDEAQWLPENKAIPTGKGYWLIFQSLKDGEIVGS